MVGTVFLHQIGATTLPKCPFTLPSFTFYQTGCNLISKGYSLSLSLFYRTSFLSTAAAKEKKQKKTANSITGFSAIANYSIGCVFQTEKPLKRGSMFSNSINAISSFLHCSLKSPETMKIRQRYLEKLTCGVNIQNLEHAVHSFTKRKMACIQRFMKARFSFNFLFF
jgi:hypothetical protein